jgi:ABC-type Fe3+/spermidine/putrescine transport system ATPase subunit
VLLLDEPLGALDLKLRQEMQVELKRSRRSDRFVYVRTTRKSVDDEHSRCSTRAGSSVGSPAGGYEHPQTEFVAGFVGAPNVPGGR